MRSFHVSYNPTFRRQIQRPNPRPKPRTSQNPRQWPRPRSILSLKLRPIQCPGIGPGLEGESSEKKNVV